MEAELSFPRLISEYFVQCFEFKRNGFSGEATASVKFVMVWVAETGDGGVLFNLGNDMVKLGAKKHIKVDVADNPWGQSNGVSSKIPRVRVREYGGIAFHG